MDEWRVEVELNDERHGLSLGERLRSRRLDDEARDRLGGGAVVTRDGSRVFVYTDTEESAHEAERVLRSVINEDELSADIWISRWHPDAETWKDASEPLPETESDRIAEYRGREAAALAEAEETGEMPFEVRVDFERLEDALELAEELRDAGNPVRRRWRHVFIGVPTEERAAELAEELKAKVPDDAKIEVEAHGVRYPPFTVLGWST